MDAGEEWTETRSPCPACGLARDLVWISRTLRARSESKPIRFLAWQCCGKTQAPAAERRRLEMVLEELRMWDEF